MNPLPGPTTLKLVDPMAQQLCDTGLCKLFWRRGRLRVSVCLSVCLSLGGPGKAVGLQCVCLCVFG